MIYRLEIGDLDNLYIITGGLTGLTEFEPVELLGAATPAFIRVDSSDDDIFTPIIKQSLEVNLIKTAEGEFDEILAGNDNETWGILIENGYLYLSEGYITVSDDATVKFKGTLTLETYSEQFKQISAVKFTFHDKLEPQDEDLFYTNTQYKNVCDIIACCVNKAICADKLYLEWPYTLSSSNDPQEFFIDVEAFDGKKRKEVLETVLKDFGLQLYTDFSLESQTTIIYSGALVIRSVINHVDFSNTFWELDLTSFVSSVCGKEYFTYTGDIGTAIEKTRFLLASNAYELENNETSLELVRVASSIIASNKYDISANLIFRGVYDKKYVASITYPPSLPIYPDGVTRNEYCPLIYIAPPPPPYDPGGYEDIYQDLIDLLTGVKTKDDYLHPQVAQYFANKDYEGFILRQIKNAQPNPDFMAITSDIIELNHAQFTSNKIKFNFKIKSSGYRASYVNNPWGTLYCSILLYKNGVAYYNNGSNWYQFTSQTQLLQYNGLGIKQLEDVELSYDFEITSTTSVQIMPVLIMSHPSDLIYGHAIIKELVITPVYNVTDEIPTELTLTTVLSGNNRKNIDFEAKIVNTINVKSSGYALRYVIKDVNSNYPLTITYKSLSQTLLAHLSDQYGWQYNGNRWIVDCTFKGLSPFNLVGQFGLEEKILMITSGDYDVKRKEFKGKLVQVLEVGDDAYRLEKDNFDHFTWDDYSFMMLK